jgi:hypothetical protein
VAVWAGEPLSVTFTVNVEVPAVVGVPVTAPLEAFSDSPAGKVPEAMLQVKGAVPPCAFSVDEYPRLPVPFGSETVLIFKVAGAITMLNCCVAVCTGELLSVNLIMNVDVPPDVGVPLITPVLPFSEVPAGSDPEATDQL